MQTTKLEPNMGIHQALEKTHIAKTILSACVYSGMTRSDSLTILEHLRGACALMQGLDEMLAGKENPKQGD